MEATTRHLLLALAAAAALAGCAVDVEGAACATPGSPEGCPSGQACGTGGTCSRAAAACSPCTPGALSCQGGDVRRCTAEGDPACGAWALATACVAGLTTCGVPAGGGTPECRCEAFVADPAGAAASTACRFTTPAAAIAEARRFAISEVVLGGPAGQDYGGADALVIPAGVAVVGGDQPLDPASRVLTLGGAGAAVVLGDGASLAGATVRRAAGGPDTAVAISGASPGGRSSLASMVIDAQGAGGAFATGVRVTGAGAVSLVGLGVLGATTAGLEVARDGATDAVTAVDLAVDGGASALSPGGAGYGVRLTTGELTLRRPAVKGCGNAGVLVAGSLASARLSVEGGALHHNHGTGLSAQGLGKLDLAGTRICANRGGLDVNLAGTFRTVGGLFLGAGAPVEQAVSGLRVFDNDGDQVGIGPGTGTWNLSGPSADGAACGAGVNAFSGYGAGPPRTYGVAAAGNVDVSWNAWPGAVPSLGADVLKIGSPAITLGTEPTVGNGSAYCALPADLTCPDP